MQQSEGRAVAISPYVGGNIAVFFGAGAREVTHDATRRMAEAGGENIKMVTTLNTPIETGELRGSWRREPTEPIDDGFRSRVTTNVSYAPFVENGTGLWGPKHAKYKISPKKPGGVLRFFWPKVGKIVTLAYVMHPGSPGNYMMAIGLNVTDSELKRANGATIVGEEMRRWVVEMEAQAERQ